VRRDPLPPAHVRVTASAVVRKWLIDGQLNRLSHALGTVLTLPTFDTSEVVAAMTTDTDVKFLLTGGVMMGGVPIRGYYVSDAPFRDRPSIPIDSMPTVCLPPSRFLRMRRVYHDGEWFTVEQIVRLVANKLGGVHFDQSRERDWQPTLERAAEFFTLGNPDGLREMQLIETRSPKHSIRIIVPPEVGHIWTCLDIELLAAAQAFINVQCDGQPLVDWAANASPGLPSESSQ
jgi:hypothetical protein